MRGAEVGDEGFLWRMLLEAAHAGDEVDGVEALRQVPELARYVEGWGRPSDLGVVATNGDGEPKSSSPPSLSGSATYRTRPRRDRVRRRRPSPPSGMTTASAPYLPNPAALRLMPPSAPNDRQRCIR